MAFPRRTNQRRANGEGFTENEKNDGEWNNKLQFVAHDMHYTITE